MITRLLALIVLLTSCRKEAAAPAKTTSAEPAVEKIHQGARAYFEEEDRNAPPQGTILPRVGKLRSVSPGDKTTAYVWKAVIEVDPADERVRRVLDKARAEGLTLDAGDAGAAVYEEEVVGAGVEVTDYGPGFGYAIQGGALQIIVRPDDDFHRNDPTGFTISVGIAGG